MTAPPPAYDADKDPGCLADRDRWDRDCPRCKDCGQRFGLPGDHRTRCAVCWRAHAHFIQA